MVRSAAFVSGLATLSAGTTILTTLDSVPGFGQVEGFTYPRLGGDLGDEVVFATYSSTDTALLVFDSAGAGLLDGVNSTTSAGSGTLSGFGDFSVSKGSHPAGPPVATFVSSVSGTTGVFVQLPTGVIVEIASSSQTFAPAGGQFTYLGEPSVEVSTDKSTIYVAFAARGGTSWRGLLLAAVPSDARHNSDVSLTVVVDTSTPIPNSPVPVNFKCLTVPQATAGGDVVFWGSNCGSTGSSLVTEQFDNLAMYKTQTRQSHCLTRSHGMVGAENVNPGIWRWNAGSLEEVVNFQTTVPGGQDGETFIAFSDVGASLDGTAAVVGLGSSGTLGVFKGAPGKGLSKVADNQTPVPGYSGWNFGDFPSIPSITEHGNVVFFGAASADVAGIFAENGDGTLSTVINYDTKVDGQETLYIGFGDGAASNGLAAAYMVLQDTTCGVWTLDIPESESHMV